MGDPSGLLSKKTILSIFIAALFLFNLVQPDLTIQAATSLTLTPITWNVIGLDSNKVTAGPNHFPVGARVCNTGGSPTSVTGINFIWDDSQGIFSSDSNADAYINLRDGSTNTLYSIGSPLELAAGACSDAYFEVEVNRDPGAYDQTRQYHITAVDAGGTASTTIPRQLFVEHLVSQSRNAVTDIQLAPDISGSAGTYDSVAPGGTLVMLKGNTYWIKLVGATATNGYEQIESFINLPNTIFQVLSVNHTYTANTAATLSPPYTFGSTLYGNACDWDSDPNSPNYLSCLATGKLGGGIVVEYQVKILSVPNEPLTNPEPIGTLIYDFSGSSFHYNADFSTSARLVAIADPTAVSISKRFTPSIISLGGTSRLTITINNTNPAAVSGYSLIDPSPSNMVVASPPNATTNSCGSPTFTPSANDTSLNFSNGTVAANSSCTIQVNVTTTEVGNPFTNTTNDLFVGSIDTNLSASADLEVTDEPTPPTCAPGLELVAWEFNAGETGYGPTFRSDDVPAAAIGTGSGTAVSINTTSGNPSANSLQGVGGWPGPEPVTYPSSTYIDFYVDTSKFTNVNLSLNYYLDNNWNNASNNGIAILTSTDGFSNFSQAYRAAGMNRNTWSSVPITPILSNQNGNTGFRFFAWGAATGGTIQSVFLDHIVLTGCGIPRPKISKAFSPDPISVGGISTLTFTLSNNYNISLTGVNFTDDLPAGLVVAAAPNLTNTCGGTWANGSATQLSLSGASIPARIASQAVEGSCTVSVDVTATTPGSHPNISGFISAQYVSGTTQNITNNTSTGYATANLSAVQPLMISKIFAPNPILTGATSTLTFTIINPNQNDTSVGVAFADTFPPGLTNTNPANTSGTTCSGTLTAASGGNSVTLSGGTLAGGASCVVKTTVTAAAAGTYPNVSSAVSHLIGGSPVYGNTASDTLTVNLANPAIAILKQVGASNSGPWFDTLAIAAGGDVWYRFTVENLGDVPFSSFNVTDPTLAGLGLGDPVTCSWATTNLPSTLPVLPVGTASIDPSATCVVGPVTASAGSHTNTATVQATYNSELYVSSDSAVYKTTALTLVKNVTETYYAAVGNVLHYSYQVTNSGAASLAGPVAVSDDKVTVTCPAVNSVVPDGDDWLDAGESLTCSATYTIGSGDIGGGLYVTNTASAKVGGVTSPESSATVPYQSLDLTITLANDTGTNAIDLGDSFTWTVTTASAGDIGSAFASGETIFSLPLASGPTYGSVTLDSLTQVSGTGSISCSIVSDTLSCTAASGTVILGTAGSFAVSFSVTPTATGTLSGTATVDPSDVRYETNEANNTSSDTIEVNSPTAVLVTLLSAVRINGNQGLLSWDTAEEIDLLGFNLYRSLKQGAGYVQINSTLIPAHNPGAMLGSHYTFIDPTAQAGVTYYYRLEAVEQSLIITPVGETVLPGFAIYLPSIKLSK